MRAEPPRKRGAQEPAQDSGRDGEAYPRRAPRAWVGLATLQAGIDLSWTEISGAHKLVVEAAEPTPVIARQVDLARQLLHGEAGGI